MCGKGVEPPWTGSTGSVLAVVGAQQHCRVIQCWKGEHEGLKQEGT